MKIILRHLVIWLVGVFLFSWDVSAQTVQAMKLLTSQVGWARSGQYLYWTTDAGAHWKDITPPASSMEMMNSVFFLDTSAGWVILAHADDQGQQQFRIASTSDAGVTWSTSPLNLPWKRYPEDFSGGVYVSFRDKLHGWIELDLMSSSSLSVGRLLATDDGAKTWNAPQGDPGEAGSLCFFSSTDGLLTAGLGNSELWATHDGSKTWQQMSFKAPPSISPADLPAYGEPICRTSKHGLMPVTYTPTDYPERRGFATALVLFVTDDAGKTWSIDTIVPNLPDISHGYTVQSAIVDSSAITVTESAGIVTMAVASPNTEVRRITLSTFKEVPDISFADATHGWASTHSGMFSTNDGGATWIPIAPTKAITPAPKSMRSKSRLRSRFASLSSVAVSTGRKETSIASGREIHLGFDTGQVPSPWVMNSWWEYSPYYSYQVSLPGAANHRTNPGLTQGWITTIESQGWGLWPVWVGPQAQCWGGPATAPRINPSNPTSQGQAEAANAINALQSLGGNLTNTIIYYDIEYYDASNPLNAACASNVVAFLNGWISGMHSGGYKAGVYGNIGPAVLNFTQLSPLPDDVWIALAPSRSTPPQVTVWSLASGSLSLCDPYSASANSCNPLWASHQRIHQYLLDTKNLRYTETWGGEPVIIDPDIIDADVARLSSGTKTYNYLFTSFEPDGNVTNPYGINNIGINPNYGGFINGSMAGNIGQILEIWEYWFNGQLLNWGNLLYNPDSNTYQIPPGYPNTGQCGGFLYCTTSMRAMNNAGWIVGAWSDANNVGHGFVNKGGTYTSID